MKILLFCFQTDLLTHVKKVARTAQDQIGMALVCHTLILKAFPVKMLG